MLDNLTKDVHISLVSWDRLFRLLKQFECLLRSGDIRRRYVWTCLGGHRLWTMQRRVSCWSASLYEKRWREVVAFLRRFDPLLPLLAETWVQARFATGKAGDTGLDDTDQAQARWAGEEAQGLHSFVPAVITEAFQSSWFCHYCGAISLLEGFPTKLAEWCAACRCHDCLHDLVPPYSLR